jgi:hypothetical protein
MGFCLQKRVIPLFLAICTLLMVAVFSVSAQAAINPQINFQGKLTNPDGTNVTNGSYSIVFAFYTVASGGAAVWTETQGSVTVTDGIFRVALGSVTALPGSVDFNSANLYLGITVGVDPEMSPRVRMTAVPYAFNSDTLDGRDGTGFVQLGVATAQTDASTNASIFVNKTAAGNLLQLQATASNILTLSNTGVFTLVGSLNSSGGAISLSGNAGSNITTSTGALTLTSAAAATWSTTAGNLTIQAGSGTVSLGSSTALTADAALNITSATTNALTLDSGTTGAINLGTNANAKVITIGNVTGATSISALVGTGTAAYSIGGPASAVYLRIDSTNNRAYIGNPTADSTGFLLVQDAKNTTGDPTGVNGASYYNSNAASGKFRCYENNAWRDCIDDRRTAFNYYNDFMGATSDGNITYATTGAGAANSATAVGSVAGHPGILQHQTGTTATGNPRFISTATAGILLGNSSVWRYSSGVRIPALSSGTQRFTYRAGFMDTATVDAIDGCYFRYVDNVNAGNWQGVCRNNNAESTCNTAIAVAANTWYRLDVVVNAAGTSADFQTDSTTRCSVVANIPTGAGRGTAFGSMVLKSVGTTTSLVDVDYIQVRGEFASR